MLSALFSESFEGACLLLVQTIKQWSYNGRRTEIGCKFRSDQLAAIGKLMGMRRASHRMHAIDSSRPQNGSCVQLLPDH